MKKTNALLFILACACGPLLADEPGDSAERTLRRTLTPAAVAYEGTLTVTHWYGKDTRTEDVRVRFSPPSSYRWEFLRPDGSLRRVVVSDGTKEVIDYLDHDKKLKGGAVKRAPRQMPAEQEWSLLQRNYHVVANGSAMVAGRPALLIRVEPLSEGKLLQELAVDKQTGVVLENKRYRPHGNFVVRSRFQHFIVARAFPKGTFVIASDAATVEDHQFAPDFLSKESWGKITGRTSKLPNSLPHGFTLESVDYFTVDEKNVDHFRYTDGLSTVSVFQTKQNIKTDSLRAMSEEGNLLPYNKAGSHYMLMGDASIDILKDLAHAFP